MTRIKDQYRFVGEFPDRVKGTLSDLQVLRTAAETEDMIRNGKMPELDLHISITEQIARGKIIVFIEQMRKQGKRYCRIVHGIGNGTMKKITDKVIAELKGSGLVAETFPSANSKCIAAAEVVILSEKSSE